MTMTKNVLSLPFDKQLKLQKIAKKKRKTKKGKEIGRKVHLRAHKSWSKEFHFATLSFISNDRRCCVLNRLIFVDDDGICSVGIVYAFSRVLSIGLNTTLESSRHLISCLLGGERVVEMSSSGFHGNRCQFLIIQ